MRFDAGLLRIDRLIVHDVPRRLISETSDVILSERESELDMELRNYFHARIRGCVAKKAFGVNFDPKIESPVPAFVTTILDGNDTEFVGGSQRLAQHLHRIHTGNMSAGLLVIMFGVVGSNTCIVILKLEKEGALKVERVGAGNTATFSLKLLNDLMLGQRTRVFKVGLFVAGQTTSGWAYDDQMAEANAGQVADYFLRFLGCGLAKQPEIETQTFFNVAHASFNEDVQDPEKRARYQIALFAELQSTNAEISPRDFAQRHLDIEDRQKLIDRLTSAEVSELSIRKDTSLIKARLKNVQWDFESGIALIGPSATIDEKVSREEVEDGRVRVRFEDRIVKVRGAR